MKDKLQERLAALKTEHETGQKMLAELEAKRQNLVQTLLRIDGAIQVLTELGSAEPVAARENGAHAMPLS